MVDTSRTLAALQALFADNTSGDISPQDLRDFLVSVFALTTKGDVLCIDGSGIITRLGVGANDEVLTADSAQATGLKWASSLSPADHTAIGDDAPHHAESHTVASHSDTTATGAETETLTDGSDADALHAHGNHGVTHNAAHGIAKHTGHATWKALYTDGSGDEQELALGAANTILRSAGAGSAPTMSAMNVSKIIMFHSPSATLAVEDWLSDQAVRVPAAGKHGTWTPGTIYVRVGTAGTGTNTILFRTSTTLTGARTTRATVNLGAAREASAAITWTPADGEYIWVEMSAVGGTAPQNGVAQVDLVEAVFA